MQAHSMWYFVDVTLLPRLKTVWPLVHHVWYILYVGFMKFGGLYLWPLDLKILSWVTFLMDNSCIKSFLSYNPGKYKWAKKKLTLWPVWSCTKVMAHDLTCHFKYQLLLLLLYVRSDVICRSCLTVLPSWNLKVTRTRPRVIYGRPVTPRWVTRTSRLQLGCTAKTSNTSRWQNLVTAVVR